MWEKHKRMCEKADSTKDEIALIIQKIEDELRSSFSVGSILEDSCISRVPYIQDALQSHLLSPSSAIMERGGKRLRPLLLILLTRMFGGDEFFAYKATPLIEGVHTASLIHDDIEDGSILRRSAPALHVVHGVDVALNAGTALYLFSLGLIEKQKESIRAPMYKASIEALKKLHIGQAMDIKHHNNYALPFDVGMYEAMARLKTGTLFALASEIALLISEKRCDEGGACVLFEELGLAFQMLDDIKNISTGNVGKERGDDIVEGKLSFPIVLHLAKKPKDKELIISFFARAKKEGIASQAVGRCCELLESSGVVEEGGQIAKKKVDLVFEKLYKLYGSSFELDLVASVFSNLFSR